MHSPFLFYGKQCYFEWRNIIFPTAITWPSNGSFFGGDVSSRKKNIPGLISQNCHVSKKYEEEECRLGSVRRFSHIPFFNGQFGKRHQNPNFRSSKSTSFSGKGKCAPEKFEPRGIQGLLKTIFKITLESVLTLETRFLKHEGFFWREGQFRQSPRAIIPPPRDTV